MLLLVGCVLSVLSTSLGHRRQHMLLLVGCVLSVLCPCLGHRRQNIIIILTDDQGSADVGFANPSSPFRTENIDNIAAKSVRLSTYYVHPTCSPTRAALLTGRYAA